MLPPLQRYFASPTPRTRRTLGWPVPALLNEQLELTHGQELHMTQRTIQQQNDLALILLRPEYGKISIKEKSLVFKIINGIWEKSEAQTGYLGLYDSTGL